MNLETTPAPLTSGEFSIILIGETATEREIMTFGVTTVGFPVEGYHLLKSVIESFEGPYLLRGHSGPSPFAFNRQSVVNMIGSVRESIETDFRYALWGVLTAAGLPGEGWSLSLTHQSRSDVIRVAFDGEIYTFSVGIVAGEDYREDCTSCQDGRRLLQMALNEINGAIVVDVGTIEGDTCAYGKHNRITATPGDTKLIISNPRDFSDDVSSFPDWFREMNTGARDMASSEVYFSLI